jgi:hypothetical protein
MLLDSTFIQQTLSTGYPRFLRLFHEFFAKIAVHTDTVYSQTYQRHVQLSACSLEILSSFVSPETVLILRAISNFEALYLSRSSSKLNEAVGQAFAGGARSPPDAQEGLNLSRTVANELDSARFDPLLIVSVAKNAVSSLDLMLSRLDMLVWRSLCSRSHILTCFRHPSGSSWPLLGDVRRPFSNTAAGAECIFGIFFISMLVSITKTRRGAYWGCRKNYSAKHPGKLCFTGYLWSFIQFHNRIYARHMTASSIRFSLLLGER